MVDLKTNAVYYIELSDATDGSFSTNIQSTQFFPTVDMQKVLIKTLSSLGGNDTDEPNWF